MERTPTENSLRTSLTNEELLAKYAAGEVSAFEEFFRRHRTLIYVYLRSRVGRSDSAEAFQLTFLRVHRSVASYDPACSALDWLMAIARNVRYDLRRKRAKQGTHRNDRGLERSENPDCRNEARRVLESLLAELDEPDRDLLQRRFAADDSDDSLADPPDCPGELPGSGC